MTAVADRIGFDEFLKVDIRVGTIVAAEPFPEARKPAYRLQIDFGPDIGLRRTSAQITANYALEDLFGPQVDAVGKFPQRQIPQINTEFLTRALPDELLEDVMATVEREVTNGGRLYRECG
jgi:tRNA-binding protein